MNRKSNVIRNCHFAKSCTQKSIALLKLFTSTPHLAALQSVIKLPTKTDLKNSLPNSAKTKDVVLEEVS